MKSYLYIVSILVLTFLQGCSQKSLEDIVLKDLLEYPQYTRAYVDNIAAHGALTRQDDYDEKYFSPWGYSKPPFTLEQILWPFSSYTYDKSYGENLLPLPKEWFIQMQDRGNYDAYGTLNKKAIALCFLNLRSFPTHKPVFKDPSKAGEGFPFDYLQNSGVHANEPLFVSHLSTDGEWAYVFASYATGWVRTRNISFIDEKFTRQWKHSRQVELIDEHYPITDLAGNIIFKSRVGMRLPLVSIEEKCYIVLAVTAGKNHTSTFTKVKIPFHVGHEGKMEINTENLVHIADLMLQSNYGWGGLYEERDCSSTLRDMYAPFGVWLPRNSSEQSKVGKVISLEKLTLEEKKEMIIKEGIPFETLLYKKGHILLYLGLHRGEIAVLHNAWGVKTLHDGIEGRKIIGKTVISSLELGKELKSYDEQKGILSQLVSMNILTDKEE